GLLEINIPGVGEDPAHGAVVRVDAPAEALQGRLGRRPHSVEWGIERPAGDVRRRAGAWRPGEAEPERRHEETDAADPPPDATFRRRGLSRLACSRSAAVSRECTQSAIPTPR